MTFTSKSLNYSNHTVVQNRNQNYKGQSILHFVHIREGQRTVRVTRRSHMRIKLSCSTSFIHKMETLPWGYGFTKNCINIWLRNKLRHCPASPNGGLRNTWSRQAFPLYLPDFYEFFFRVLRHTVIFITAPYGTR